MKIEAVAKVFVAVATIFSMWCSGCLAAEIAILNTPDLPSAHSHLYPLIPEDDVSLFLGEWTVSESYPKLKPAPGNTLMWFTVRNDGWGVQGHGNGYAWMRTVDCYLIVGTSRRPVRFKDSNSDPVDYSEVVPPGYWNDLWFEIEPGVSTFLLHLPFLVRPSSSSTAIEKDVDLYVSVTH